VKSTTPSTSSSFSIWRRTVGWATPSERDAPERLPVRMTARKAPSKSHDRAAGSSADVFIHFILACEHL
jgi:hypothetical protein